MAEVQEVGRPPCTGLTLARIAEFYSRDRLGFLGNVTHWHGPVVELAPRIVLVADPAAAHDVLRYTNTRFFLSKNLFRGEVDAHQGDPLLDEWMAGRRAIVNAMVPALLERHRNWMVKEIDGICVTWLRQGIVDNPSSDLRRLTSRSFARFCFGTRPTEQVRSRIDALLKAVFPIQSSAFELPGPLRAISIQHHKAQRAKRRLEEELRRTIAHPGHDGLCDELSAVGVRESTIVRLLVSLGLAAYNVPAAVMAWTIAELTAHQEVADEIGATAGTSVEAEGTRGSILRQVLDEVLRLWPPTWMIMRTCEEDQVCGSWMVPGGSTVMVSPYLIHRTAACYDLPEMFRPSRWQDLDVPNGAYIPFSSGPRWCVGARFAVAEISTAIGVLASTLRFRLNGPVQPDTRATLTPSGFRLHVVARP